MPGGSPYAEGWLKSAAASVCGLQQDLRENIFEILWTILWSGKGFCEGKKYKINILKFLVFRLCLMVSNNCQQMLHIYDSQGELLELMRGELLLLMKNVQACPEESIKILLSVDGMISWFCHWAWLKCYINIELESFHMLKTVLVSFLFWTLDVIRLKNRSILSFWWQMARAWHYIFCFC